MPTPAPQHLYVGTQAALAVLLATAQTTFGLYAVKTAGLGALELALVGTALELSIAVALWLTVLMAVATFVFAIAPTFWLALLGFWIARWGRFAMHPLLTAHVNRGLAPGVRATVLSILGQAGAVGEVCGGPLVGLVGTLRNVRTALMTSAAVLLPAVALYARALRNFR